MRILLQVERQTDSQRVPEGVAILESPWEEQQSGCCHVLVGVVEVVRIGTHPKNTFNPVEELATPS
jgi:hypothetical protein